MTAPTLPARPMLAEVLAALTKETYTPAWEAVAPRVRLALDAVLLAPPDGTEVRPGGARWEFTVTDPAHAAETLIARGLLPDGWCDGERRGWVCAKCAERADRHVTATASSIPDLVAVASLGWPAIQRAEELARETCHALARYGCPTPDRVVWRVGSRSPANAVLWRSDTSNRAVVSVRGVLLVDDRVYGPSGPVSAIDALWTSGLALDAITDDAVRIVVPPVGGAVRPAEWGPQPSGVYGWGR